LTWGGALPDFLHAGGGDRAAAGADDLQELPGRRSSRRRPSYRLLNLSPTTWGKTFYYGRAARLATTQATKGRKGIFELLSINDAIRALINERAPTVVIRQKAVELGMIPLRGRWLAQHLRRRYNY